MTEKPGMGMGGEILLYRAEGGPSLEVRFDRESLWLDAHRMGVLFGRDRSVIVKHIHNVYATGELGRFSTCAKHAQVAADGKVRQMDVYNLDMILSVGYRVNSKRGTQFRIWATDILKSHLLKGYTVNARRLKELNRTVRLIAEVAERRDLSGDEAKAIFRVVSDYSYALDLLDDYDHQRVSLRRVSRGRVKPVGYGEALRLVGSLRTKFGGADLFGREKDGSLKSAMAAVVQTFGGKDVYPSLEEKAANLLYLLVKNHPFVDGNKRVAAALFIWFLEKNGLLYRRDGAKRVADDTLVAMTLLIASSRPEEKEVLVRVLVNLMARGNS
jgi:prophage maintenance system killer protein